MFIQVDLFEEPPTPQTITKAWNSDHKKRVSVYNSMRCKLSHTQNESVKICRKVKRSGKNT